jgi:hypothetical protein
VRVAADDCPITIYPPSEPTAPLHFECRSERGHWKGAVVTERVLGPGEENDEPPDEDEGAPGRKNKNWQLDLADKFRANREAEEAKAAAGEGATEDGDAVISDEEAARLKAEQDEPLPTQKKKGRKRQKSPAAGSR